MLPSSGYWCSDAVFDPNYDFARTLEEEFRCKPPLAGGPLFTLFFQIPAYFESNSLEGVLNSYSVVESCVESCSLDPLRSALGNAVDEWFPAEFSEELAAYDRPKLISSIRRFMDLLHASFDDYLLGRWEEAVERINRVRNAVESVIGELDVIGLWEDLLGMKFPFDHFVVLLCEPCGTVSSLLAEKVVVPSRASIENLVNAVIHEAGVHFFTPRRLLHFSLRSCICRVERRS